MVETLKCTFGEKRRKLSRKVMPNSINGFLANQVFNAGKKLKIVLSNEKINLNRVDRNLNWSYSKKLWLRKKVSIVWTIVANGSIASLVLTRFHFDEPTLINRNAFYVWIFDSWRLAVTFSTKFFTKIKTSTNYWHFWPVRNSMSRAKTEILFCVHLFKKFFVQDVAEKIRGRCLCAAWVWKLTKSIVKELSGTFRLSGYQLEDQICQGTFFQNQQFLNLDLDGKNRFVMLFGESLNIKC